MGLNLGVPTLISISLKFFAWIFLLGIFLIFKGVCGANHLKEINSILERKYFQ